jgi:hypothetical protein
VAICITRAAASGRRARLLLLGHCGLVGVLATRAFGFQLSHAVERLLVARGPLLCRLPAPIAHARLGIEFGAQPRDSRLGGRLDLFQPLTPAERPRSRCGPHRHAVLRQHIERHQPLGDQCRHPVRQQPLQQRAVRHPEIGQRMVVHRHPAAQPAIRQMLLA